MSDNRVGAYNRSAKLGEGVSVAVVCTNTWDGLNPERRAEVAAFLDLCARELRAGPIKTELDVVMVAPEEYARLLALSCPQPADASKDAAA